MLTSTSLVLVKYKKKTKNLLEKVKKETPTKLKKLHKLQKKKKKKKKKFRKKVKNIVVNGHPVNTTLYLLRYLRRQLTLPIFM